MDEAIRKLKSTTFLGRRLTRRQIAGARRARRRRGVRRTPWPNGGGR